MPSGPALSPRERAHIRREYPGTALPGKDEPAAAGTETKPCRGCGEKLLREIAAHSAAILEKAGAQWD